MLTALIAAFSSALFAGDTVQDTITNVNLDEVNVISSLKETGNSRQQSAIIGHISGVQLSDHGISGMKGLGTIAPNFFMPDYGSRQSSAVYMRGIGSRIGTPSVGLYVDNVPYYDKTAFDISFYDIANIDVLCGPQSTLYGRNAMSGLIKVQTYNPFSYSGTNVKAGYSTGDNHRQASVTHYHRLSSTLAFSAGGFYDGGDGFFRNDFSNRKQDAMKSGGGRIRTLFRPDEHFILDANVSYEYSDEGSYPYYYTGSLTENEEYESSIGKITSNLESRYRRGLFNASLNARYVGEKVNVGSVTAYQNINDRMFMDQDFLSDDIYSLEQRQKINILSEELLVTNAISSKYNWLFGANLFYEWQNINAPVVFRQDGVSWLNGIINTNANRYMPQVQAGPMTMEFSFADNIIGDVLTFGNDFDAPTLGVALFHQSSFENIFGIEGLKAVVGLRMDYEKMRMDYDSRFDFQHNYSLNGNLKPMGMAITMVPEQTFDRNYSIFGKVTNDYLELLPKVSLMYVSPLWRLHATISRGYRSGGYNAQNISEILRSQMQTQMMVDVRDVTVPVLQNQKSVPDATKAEVTAILDRMATETPADVEGSCSFKPEYAWNYEIGVQHFFSDCNLTMNVCAFLANVTDLQISKMSATGLGRTIVNAGRSRSVGVEASLKYEPIRNFTVTASYGFADATFREYSVYTSGNKEIDCRGNHVPYAPSQTFNIDAAYTLAVNNSSLHSVSFGADLSGVGKIYWDEQNLYSQPFYSLLGARIQFDFNNLKLQLWGRNIANRKYDTFWFESMSRGFSQHGKPSQFGVTASLHL